MSAWGIAGLRICRAAVGTGRRGVGGGCAPAASGPAGPYGADDVEGSKDEVEPEECVLELRRSGDSEQPAVSVRAGLGEDGANAQVAQTRVGVGGVDDHVCDLGDDGGEWCDEDGEQDFGDEPAEASRELFALVVTDGPLEEGPGVVRAVGGQLLEDGLDGSSENEGMNASGRYDMGCPLDGPGCGREPLPYDLEGPLVDGCRIRGLMSQGREGRLQLPDRHIELTPLGATALHVVLSEPVGAAMGAVRVCLIEMAERSELLLKAGRLQWMDRVGGIMGGHGLPRSEKGGSDGAFEELVALGWAGRVGEPSRGLEP